MYTCCTHIQIVRALKLRRLKASETCNYEQIIRPKEKIVFLSPRGGTGRSTFVANIAASLALKNLKVGIVDLDLKGPCLETMFSTNEGGFKLNDFLQGRCPPTSCVIDLAKYLNVKCNNLFLIPASPQAADILEIYERGYSVDELTVGLTKVVEDLELDFLLIDTHAGLDEDTLISALIADHAVILGGPDRQSRIGITYVLSTLKKLECGWKGKPISKIPTLQLRSSKERST